MINRIRDGLRQNTWWSRLLFCLPLLITSLAYPLCNSLAAASGRAIILKSPLDDLIPFTEIFILPYLYWHLQIILTFIWLIKSQRTSRSLHRLVIALAISDLVSAIIFLVMPTQMIRPEIVSDGLMNQLVQLVYTIDLPYNLFPSKHVVYALIINRAWAAAGPKRVWFRVLNHAGTILIIASTVLIKQHYTPDILGGLAVALASMLLGNILWQQLSRSPLFSLPADMH